MAETMVRPTPDEAERELFVLKGRTRVGTISASWFTKGGLGVDGEGVFLLDADGVRHSIPTPPNAALVRFTVVGSLGTDAYRSFLQLFLADEQNHRLADFPVDGFEQTDFSGLAAAGGFRWLDLGERSLGAHGGDGGYSRTDQTIDLVGRSLAEADKHHLFHRRSENGS